LLVADDETVRVDDAEPPAGRVIVVGLSEVVRPRGVEDAERVTGPKRPLRLVTVMVEVPEVTVESSRKLRLAGLLDTRKSGELVLKNSVIAMALASPDARLARFQFTSIVFVKE